MRLKSLAGLAVCVAGVLTGCATTLHVTSEPPHAYVLTSEDENGTYTQWRREAGQHITPSVAKLKRGEHFWLKVRRDGFIDPDPEFVRAEKRGKIERHFELRPILDDPDPPTPHPDPVPDPPTPPDPGPKPPTPPDPGPKPPTPLDPDPVPPVPPRPPVLKGGITADGYAAIRGGDVPGAREAAIQDALVRALEQKIGIEVTASKASNNYMLTEYRVRSSVSGTVKTYNVLSESRQNGVYEVTVQALFRDDVVRNLELDRVSVQIVLDPMDGVEDGMRAGTRVGDIVTRRLVKDGFRVLVPEEDISQVDLLLNIYGEGRKANTFGGLTTYQVEIHGDVTRLHAMDALASVAVSGRGSRKPADFEARDAAFDEHAEELATKLSDAIAKKFTKAAFHRLTVFGVSSQGRADLIAMRLRAIPGVTAVRSVTFDKYSSVPDPFDKRDVDRYNRKETKDEYLNEAHYEIDMAPEAIDTISDRINRLPDVDLIILSSDRSKTYARAY